MAYKAKILLVDDEEEILRSLGASLEEEGYEVWTAGDGTTAIQLVRTRHPDIIFLDIWIPGMDGIQTLKAIKEFDAEIEVVIMTGHGTVNTSVQAIKLGAFDFLEKPLSLDTVLDIVRRILEQNILTRETAELRPRAVQKEELIGNSQAVRHLRREIGRMAREEGPVLILGDPGTGKELVARLICAQALNRKRPLLKFSCTIWPPEELEETLLGSPTNGSGKRRSDKKSILEQAAGRVLYLASIEELPPDVQARFALYLKERAKSRAQASFLPKGPTRIIASSNRDLAKAVREGAFLPALLDSFQKRIIRVDPLRERRSDIPELTRHFLKTQCMEYGRRPKRIDDEAMQTLVACDWPGNVKELKNIVERMVISVPISQITYKDIPPSIREAVGMQGEGTRIQAYEIWDSYDEALESLEKEYLSYHLRRNSHDVRTTARSLNIDPRRLVRKVQKLRLVLDAEPPRHPLHQRTLKRSMVLAGQGLHSGIKTGLILTPLPPNSGVLFGNISTDEVVPAHIDYVESTEFATFLRKGTSHAKTTEHFLAVLNGYQITNLLVKINDELPIMDGSALDFCSIVEDAGIQEQEAFLEEIVIDRKYVIGEERPGAKFIKIEPADSFQVHYTLHYPEPIGHQEVLFVLKNEKAFKEQIAPARTFGYVKDIEKLESMGMASGGRLNNVILVDDEKVVNTTLRFPDEFARHKILDILGDFYLLGRPIRGKVTAQMTGHSENVALMKLIREQMKIV